MNNKNVLIGKVLEAKRYICGPDFDLSRGFKVKVKEIVGGGFIGEVVKGGYDVDAGEVGYWEYDEDAGDWKDC